MQQTAHPAGEAGETSPAMLHFTELGSPINCSNLSELQTNSTFKTLITAQLALSVFFVSGVGLDVCVAHLGHAVHAVHAVHVAHAAHFAMLPQVAHAAHVALDVHIQS